MQASAERQGGVPLNFARTMGAPRWVQHWKQQGSDVVGVVLETVRTAAVHCSSHVAQQQRPFTADAFVRACGRGGEGGKQLPGSKRGLNLKCSQAEEIVAAAEAGHAAVVRECAVRSRGSARNSCHKTGELRTEIVLA